MGRAAAPPSRSTTRTRGVSTLSTASSATAPASALPGAFRAGVLTALATFAVVVLPALVGWVAAPGEHARLVLRGARSAARPGSSVTRSPSGSARSASRWHRSCSCSSSSSSPLERAGASSRSSGTAVGALAWGLVLQRGVVPGYLLGYVAVAGLVALLTLGGPAVPGVAAVLGTLVVPLAGLGFALLRPAEEDSPAFVRSWFRRGPSWLPIVWRVGWRGAGVLLLGRRAHRGRPDPVLVERCRERAGSVRRQRRRRGRHRPRPARAARQRGGLGALLRRRTRLPGRRRLADHAGRGPAGPDAPRPGPRRAAGRCGLPRR